MKVLYLLGALSLTACTGIDGKYIAVCDKPIATNSVNINTNTAANSVYTQASYLAQGANIAYIVKKGDTIHSIARRFGLSPASILTKNTLINANKLSIGSTLYFPAQ